MIIRLNKFWSQRLAQMPESGMGYQRVTLVLKNNHLIENALVFNGEDCQTDEAFNPDDVMDIRLVKTNE